MTDKKLKPCFVIAPIGTDGSETRRRSDQVLKHLVKPAAEACGYAAVRADEIDKPGLITSQVIQRVVSDELVIADLTEMNPNVFYELAIRHVIRKPLVQIIEKGERIPFDVAGTRTIHFDHKDLDSVANAKDAIISQIKSLEKNPADIETPISVSLDLQNLRQSENPADRGFADIISEISAIRSDLAKASDTSSDELRDEVRSLRMALRKLANGYDDEAHPTRTRYMERFSMRLISGMDFERDAARSAIAYGLIAQSLGSNSPVLQSAALELSNKFLYGTEAAARTAEGKFKAFVRAYLETDELREGLERRKVSPFVHDILHRLARSNG